MCRVNGWVKITKVQKKRTRRRVNYTTFALPPAPFWSIPAANPYYCFALAFSFGNRNARVIDSGRH